MTIDAIRDSIHDNVGNNVRVIYNEGRNKISHYDGKVVEVYRNIFILLDDAGKKCFSYHDILTETVKVLFKV